MGIYIWGAGVSGGRFLHFIGEENVEAFVDNNEIKQGTLFLGKRVISGKDFFEGYKDDTVVVAAMSAYERIVESLEENGIYDYYDMFDCPNFVFDYPREYAFSVLDLNMQYKEDIAYLFGWNILTKLYLEARQINARIVVQNLKTHQREVYLRKNKFTESTIEESRGFPVNYLMNESYAERVDISGFAQMGKPFQPDYHHLLFHNADLERFKDSKKGESCFIVATGPSLRMEDLDRLAEKDIDCFSVNGIFAAFPNTKWRPTYYVLLDVQLAEDFDALHMDAKYIFLSDNEDGVWRQEIPENVFKIHPLIASKDIWFSPDCSYGYGSAENVTYTCIQMAAYMGYTDIYLLGVDFSQGMPGNEDSHFTKDYVIPTRTEYARNSDFRDSVTKGYYVAKQYADRTSIHIYNTTRGGYLEVFERRSFDKVMEETQ